MPLNAFSLCWALLTTVFLCTGGIWAINPGLFVRIYRRVSSGDYYAKSWEWEKSVVSLEGRIAGCFLFCMGLGGLYVLLRVMH
jgi:hypothetical protein